MNANVTLKFIELRNSELMRFWPLSEPYKPTIKNFVLMKTPMKISKILSEVIRNHGLTNTFFWYSNDFEIVRKNISFIY